LFFVGNFVGNFVEKTKKLTHAFVRSLSVDTESGTGTRIAIERQTLVHVLTAEQFMMIVTVGTRFASFWAERLAGAFAGRITRFTFAVHSQMIGRAVLTLIVRVTKVTITVSGSVASSGSVAFAVAIAHFARLSSAWLTVRTVVIVRTAHFQFVDAQVFKQFDAFWTKLEPPIFDRFLMSLTHLSALTQNKHEISSQIGTAKVPRFN
jgi:hypothetical protein